MEATSKNLLPTSSVTLKQNRKEKQAGIFRIDTDLRGMSYEKNYLFVIAREHDLLQEKWKIPHSEDSTSVHDAWRRFFERQPYSEVEMLSVQEKDCSQDPLYCAISQEGLVVLLNTSLIQPLTWCIATPEIRQNLRCNDIDLSTDLTQNYLRHSATVQAGEKTLGISHSIFHMSTRTATMFPLQIGKYAAYTVIYHHKGAPRRYTVVPSRESHRLEKMVISAYNPKRPPPCSQSVSHEQLYIPQSTLIRNKIPFTEVIQYEGEIVVILPYAYYQGFNAGPNIVEEILYGDVHWKTLHRKCPYTPCNKDCDAGEDTFDLSFTLKKPVEEDGLFVSDGEDEQVLSQARDYDCYRSPSSSSEKNASLAKKRKFGFSGLDESDKDEEPKKRKEESEKSEEEPKKSTEEPE